jgi:hypothetical protein
MLDRPALAYLAFLAVASVSLLPWITSANGNTPATAPVTADTPAVKELRDTLVQWNKVCSTWTEADFRKLYYTANARESTHTDYEARQDWEQGKTQQLVRDKWGPRAEAEFAHIYGTDTIEDDQTANITVTGDHATITWSGKDIEKTAMIKINGHWLMDMHATFARDLAEDPQAETDGVKMEALMKQAAADIVAGKFKNGDAFVDDFEKKYDALNDND